MLTITYADGFKRDAVVVVASGISHKQVVKDLGVAKTMLQAWGRDVRFQSHAMTPTTDPEACKGMAQALRRIRELEMENEVLRRAAAYLSHARITPPSDVPARQGDGRRRCLCPGASCGRVLGTGIFQTGLLQVASQAGLGP